MGSRVEQFEQIRRDREREGLSIRELASQIVEETRARSGRGDGDPEILALLGATDEEGNPDWERRMQGAERYLESVEGGPSGGLLPGVVLRFPFLREARETP